MTRIHFDPRAAFFCLILPMHDVRARFGNRRFTGETGSIWRELGVSAHPRNQGIAQSDDKKPTGETSVGRPSAIFLLGCRRRYWEALD